MTNTLLTTAIAVTVCSTIASAFWDLNTRATNRQHAQPVEYTSAALPNTTGCVTTAVATDGLVHNDTSTSNTAICSLPLFSNTTGELSTAHGLSALFRNTSGGGNTAEGGDALVSNATGATNTAIGTSALSQNVIGNNNIALGAFAGTQVTSDNNIDIGNNGEADESDTIRIGNFLHTATYIAGISGQAAAGGDTVLITDDGKLGTVNFSSERFKERIKPMDEVSEAILALNPVTFRYKNEIDPKGIPQFDLVAEEVDKVSPDLVKRDAKGDIYTVRYDAVNAMLLNEFLKEHRKNEQQEATIAAQQKQIEALRVGLQKVSAQLELNKAAPQTVLNNQ